MKNKFKEFLRVKKELFIFLGLLVATFVAVIVIAEVAVYDGDAPTISPNPDDDKDDDAVSPDEDDEDIVYTFTTPINAEYVVVRDFYDFDNPSDNNNAWIEFDGKYITSKGVSYALESDEEFDVVSVYPGKVISIDESDVIGTTITIDHGDITSVYYSVQNACVSVGDEVAQNGVIATSSASTFDIDASVHVHVQVISKENNEYIDLTTIIGKTMDDVASSIK